MVTFRSGRLEENRQKRRLVVAIVGSIAVMVFFALFSIKTLVGFSLLVDRLRGTPPIQQATQTLLLPPILDSLPTATKSATLKIMGTGSAETDVIIYVNEKEEKRITVGKNGTFETILTSLSDGTNTISARATDGKDTTSDPSNVLTVLIKKTLPVFEITAPDDNAIVNGDTNRVTVEGETEENTTVTVNGRIVVIRGDNTFSYQYPLNAGENRLTIVVTDIAGNASTVERKITYHK